MKPSIPASSPRSAPCGQRWCLPRTPHSSLTPTSLLSLVNNLKRQALVHDQIELRLRVLEAWLDNGAPDGQRVPASLNQVRIWQDPSLGIVQIGSSASFTTTHRVHGELVTRISQVLRDLAAQRSPPPLGKKKSAAQGRAQLAAHKRMLEAAANQYAAMTVELRETQLDLRVARQSLDAVRSENAQLRTKNRGLKSELTPRSSPGIVTELDSRRPASPSGNRC